uniref:Uncharacterized protein n=1 Tax=Anopheles atroparvus TaxID=41427 RepID=A0A182J9A3_ANOAO
MPTRHGGYGGFEMNTTFFFVILPHLMFLHMVQACQARLRSMEGACGFASGRCQNRMEPKHREHGGRQTPVAANPKARNTRKTQVTAAVIGSALLQQQNKTKQNKIKPTLLHYTMHSAVASRHNTDTVRVNGGSVAQNRLNSTFHARTRPKMGGTGGVCLRLRAERHRLPLGEIRKRRHTSAARTTVRSNTKSVPRRDRIHSACIDTSSAGLVVSPTFTLKHGRERWSASRQQTRVTL